MGINKKNRYLLIMFTSKISSKHKTILVEIAYLGGIAFLYIYLFHSLPKHTTQNMYPITLDDNGGFICNLNEFKYQLIQGLDYHLTDADRLVSELSELLTEDCTKVPYNARNNTKLMYVILQSVNPDDRLLFIEKQACGVPGLFTIASSNYSMAFRRILQSVGSAERMQLLMNTKGSIGGMSILHWAAVLAITWGTEMVETILKSISKEERYILLQIGESSPPCMLSW